MQKNKKNYRNKYQNNKYKHKTKKHYPLVDVKNINTKNNFIIDANGKKKFWLKKRVPRKLFSVLRLKFNFIHQRWSLKGKKDKMYPFFFKKPYFLKNIFFFLFVNKCKKNIFANFSNILGNVIYKASSGFFHKRSLRKTFFATGFLLKKMQSFVVIKKIFLDQKKKEPKNFFFLLNVVGGNYQRGFKKNLKDFMKRRTSNFIKVNELKCKAHNGVRKPKKRRK